MKNGKPLAPFYPIVDSAIWVARVTVAGARLVQLRIKDSAADALTREIVAARDICRATGAQLIVNDHWEIAMAQGCDYIHLGQSDLDTADIPALRRAGLRLGVSTHDHQELDRALALKPDYIALGPIYPTLLKQMPWAPQGLERITEWKRLIGAVPLVAIGGLTQDRLAGVFAAGADSAAVVTDIVRAADPDAQARAWNALAQKLTGHAL